MPVLVPMNMSFLTFCALWLIPGWGDDPRPAASPERIEQLKDPEVRARLLDGVAVARRPASTAASPTGTTTSSATPSPPENEGLDDRGREATSPPSGAHEPFDTLLDIVIADDLRTILWPAPTDNDRRSTGRCAPRSGTTPGR